MDISEAVNPDETVDLDEFPWPWDSNHFVRVSARHVFEHLENPIQAVEEVARILTDDGIFRLTYPIGHTRWEDPTHKQFWGWHTASTLAGDRQHEHEIGVPLRLVDRSVDWFISEQEHLVRWYTKYRLWRRGAGPWLEQVPGLYADVKATYEVDTNS